MPDELTPNAPDGPEPPETLDEPPEADKRLNPTVVRPAAGTPTPSFTPTAAESSTRELAASVVAGRYELGELIAQGGMGMIYTAHDKVLSRRVAVKVLRPHLTQSDAAARFRDEARITGQLQHPGVPPVHDLSTLPDGRPFLAMKLIKGQTLAHMLKDRTSLPTDWPRFVQVFEQICQTVAFAHSRDVIHRDLKPANIMVGSFGEVQVMDWGLAKLVELPIRR